MSFFNKKEEVIEIQLTQYGKCVLAAGEFMPEYYAFYDDDILYDSNHASYDESHTVSEDRIKQTPRTKTQSIFLGRESQFQKNMKNFTNSINMDPQGKDYIPYQSTDEREYSLGMPLGTSNYNSKNRPSWSVKFLNGKLKSSTSYVTGAYLSDGRQMNIPQLEVTVAHKLSIGLNENLIGLDADSPESGVDNASMTFEDGTYIINEEDFLLLDIEEQNGVAKNQNFVIEVYEVEEDSDGKELLRPLRFTPKPQRVVNGLLVDTNSLPVGQPTITPDYTDYFFELSKDEEIDRDKFDIYMQKIKNLYADQLPSTNLTPVPDGIPALGSEPSAGPLTYAPSDFVPEDIYNGMDPNEDIECDDE